MTGIIGQTVTSSLKRWLKSVCPRGYAAYQRGRARLAMWREILRRLRGESTRDRVALALSVVADTLDATLVGRSWAPCTWAKCVILDPAWGVRAAPRAGTDDIYLLLPGREEDVESAILEPLRNGDIFVDCGANVCHYTLRAARIVGSEGLVIAIEPVRETAAALSRNVTLNGCVNVQLVRCAVGRTEGRAVIAAPARIYGMASLKPIERVAFRVPIRSLGEASVCRLDDLCAALRHVRVLKLDVEGSELDVLEGSLGLLRRTDVVVCECGRNRDAIVDLLAAQGFRVRPLAFTTYISAIRNPQL